jgi:hypothetical protein
MLNPTHQETCTRTVEFPAPYLDQERTYRLEVSAQALDEQGRLIDELIGYAFDTLGARGLDLRIYRAEG